MLKAEKQRIMSDFADAVLHQGPVQGTTHNLYRYPARFSPRFARSAIEAFTPHDGSVMDPFVGGGTTLVEARLAGRRSYGADISSLAVFLSKTKTIPLTKADVESVREWFFGTIHRLSIHRPANGLVDEAFDGYDKNMPWRLRKLCEQYLETIHELTVTRQQRFARCVLLRCGQWAMDCRKRIPSSDEFRSSLIGYFEDACEGMKQYRKELARRTRDLEGKTPNCRCVQREAAVLSAADFGKAWKSKTDLVLTSPPYPGVHVLYHRWNVRGRRETPAPFWLADCLDGHGAVHYTLGDRRQEGLTNYYAGIVNSFTNIRSLLKDDGLVVQLVAFSEDDWQLDAFLTSMNDAGFVEVLPKQLGLQCSDDRLWRTVPGRRWYSMIRGDIPSSREVVLFHRKS